MYINVFSFQMCVLLCKKMLKSSLCSERNLLFVLWPKKQPVTGLVHGTEDSTTNVFNLVNDILHSPSVRNDKP